MMNYRNIAHRSLSAGCTAWQLTRAKLINIFLDFIIKKIAP
jgi:hypothetical protein